jgi:hypothetical protein
VLYKLISLGMSFEFAAIGLMFVRSHSLTLALSYLLLHAVASSVLAAALILVLPPQYRKPRKWVLLYLFAFNFFMPMIGLVCLLLGPVLGLWLPRLIKKNSFEIADNPQFTTHRNHEGTGFRGGQVRAQLGNTSAPLDQRLKALLAVQDTPARATGSLLRTLLSDPADDMRLLAYGILDGKEKSITTRILENRRQLDATPEPAEQFRLNKLIAELYWELIYQDLVQGDMRSFSAEQVRRYAVAALRLRDDDAGLWFLLTRLELFSHRVEVAEHALFAAQEASFARERLLPYFAELRFLQRRFDEVRHLFDEMADRAGVPALAQSRHYWLPPAIGQQATPRVYRQDEESSTP